MTDRRFNEIVIEASSLRGPHGRSYKACCSSCGTYHRVDAQEFERDDLAGGTYVPSIVGAEEMGYVAKMRAWNCCHEGEQPMDGFPEDPR